MTTVDKVLLKLDYVSKEQENELAFFALDDVIDRFETAIAVIYSEAGIPLKSYNYLVSEDMRRNLTDVYMICDIPEKN